MESDETQEGDDMAATNKTIRVQITKRGRKWYQAIVLPSLYRAQVAINDAAPDLEIGAEMTLTVIDRSERGAYGSVLKFEPVDAQAQAHAAAQQAAAQAAMREAKRWFNYAAMDAERGLSRTNAIRRALADNTPGLEGRRQALQARVDANIARDDSDIAAKSDGFGIGELGRVPVTPRAKPAAPKHESCHYCGLPATGWGFFGEPVCDDCSH